MDLKLSNIPRMNTVNAEEVRLFFLTSHQKRQSLVKKKLYIKILEIEMHYLPSIVIVGMNNVKCMIKI